MSIEPSNLEADTTGPDDIESAEEGLGALTAAYVKTPEGAEYFKLPIGAKIVGKVRARLEEDVDNLEEDDDGGEPQLRVGRATHTRLATLGKDVKPGDIITSKARGPLVVHASKLRKDHTGADVNEVHTMDHEGKTRIRVLPTSKSVGTLVSNKKVAAPKTDKTEAKDDKTAPSAAPTPPKAKPPTPTPAATKPKPDAKPDPEPEKDDVKAPAAKVAPKTTPPAPKPADKPEPDKAEADTPAPAKKAPAKKAAPKADTTPAPDKAADEPDTKAGDLPPLTDQEYKNYQTQLENTINQALRRGLDTETSETLNGNGMTWKPARAKLHKEIVDAIWKSEGANVPTDGQAVMAGGLGGSGKGTVLSQYAGLDPKNFLTIDPDRVKEEMAKRDMVPKVKGITALEGAALIQKESTHIAALLAKRAYKSRTNVIWDMTMANDYVVSQRLGQLKSNGYKKIDAVFVHVPAQVSANRAIARHRKGMEDHRNGRGQGGRYVPPQIILAAGAGKNDTYNHKVFQRFKSSFDEWVRFDNSTDGGTPTKLDGTGKWK